MPSGLQPTATASPRGGVEIRHQQINGRGRHRTQPRHDVGLGEFEEPGHLLCLRSVGAERQSSPHFIRATSNSFGLAGWRLRHSSEVPRYRYNRVVLPAVTLLLLLTSSAPVAETVVLPGQTRTVRLLPAQRSVLQKLDAAARRFGDPLLAAG